MYSNYLKSKIGSLILGVSLASGIAMVAGITAQAQDRGNRDRQVNANRDRDWDRDGDRRQSRDQARNRNTSHYDRYRGRVSYQNRDQYRNDRYRGYQRPPVRGIETPRYGNRRSMATIITATTVLTQSHDYSGGNYEESWFQDG
jgi:Ni/Co efflux regulator RcnB